MSMNDDAGIELMTTAEVADMLRIGPRTVLEMAKDGRLPTLRIRNSRRYLFDRRQIIDSMNN